MYVRFVDHKRTWILGDRVHGDSPCDAQQVEVFLRAAVNQSPLFRFVDHARRYVFPD
jgi:hypothetical protein